MKIKLSKNKWQEMGKKAGWIKESANGMERLVVKVNLEDEKSIKEAEKQKELLENAGYTLEDTISGLNTSELIYVLKN